MVFYASPTQRAAVVRTLSRSEATAALRGFRRFAGEPVEIDCPSVETIASRDIIELYMALYGARDVRWRDGEGRVTERQPLAGILTNLLRDLYALPSQILRQRRGARMAAQLRARLSPVTEPERALYLRSDHWFGTRSGGSVGHVRGVIDALRRLGVATEVVATDRLTGVPDDAQFHLCRPVYGMGRNIPCLPELTYNDQMLDFVEGQWSAWRPDFIYQRLSLCNFVGAALRRRHEIPFVVEYNGSLAWVARHWDQRPLLLERTTLAVERSALDSADLIVVMSRAIRDGLAARGLPVDRILVNPNGVDPDIYHPAADGGAIRGRNGIGDEIVIGFIGTYGKWHGAETLSRAFARLLTDRPDLRMRVRLLMIGDGPTRLAAEQVLREVGAADRSIFTGLVPQAEGPAHLAACDILVSPHVPNPDGSPFFGSPTKLFEYMAMGRPVLASDLDQIGEVLKHRETAWMVPPGDEEALAKGLAVLIDDPALRARLGEAARRDVVAKYSWTAHVQRILAALGGAA